MSLLSGTLAFLIGAMVKPTRPEIDPRDEEIAELKVALEAAIASRDHWEKTASDWQRVADERGAYIAAQNHQIEALYCRIANFSIPRTASQFQGNLQLAQQANLQFNHQRAGLSSQQRAGLSSQWGVCDCSPPGRSALLSRGE
jgi:hypothetical protein